MLRHTLSFLAMLSLLSARALATFTAVIQTSIGPNPIDPDTTQYRATALHDIENGLQGSSGQGVPQEYFVTGPVITPGDLISSGTPTESGFISWDGDADVSDNYVFQHGNGLYAGLSLTSDTPFTLTELSLTVSSTDSGNAFDLGPVAFTAYNNWLLGIEANGSITTNPSDPIVKLYYAGAFLALDASLEPGATNQDQLDAVDSYISENAPFDITESFSMNGVVVGSDTVTVSDAVNVPEPVMLPAVAIAGFALLKNRRRLRR